MKEIVKLYLKSFSSDILILNHSRLDLVNVKYINLENNGLTKIEPEILSELPSLEILDLSRNILVELDKNVFKNLSALKKLNLCGNNINK